MEKDFWGKLKSDIGKRKTSGSLGNSELQGGIYKTNSSLVPKDCTTRKKKNEIEILADAIVDYMQWRERQFQLKENRRKEGFRMAWRNRKRDKLVENKDQTC